MRYSSLVERLDIPSSRAWEIHFEANRRKEAGEDIIILSIGDHEFDTPTSIVNAVKQSLDKGRHHYTPAAGEPHFREAIAHYHRQVTGQEVNATNVVVTPGAQCSLFIASMTLFESGDEVLAFDPMYSTYEATILSSGASIKPVPLSTTNGFSVDVEKLKDAITPRTKGLLLNFPHNPTGIILERSGWHAIAELCEKHDLSVISDEVYASVVFDGEHISPVSIDGLADRTVVASSLSKSHAMTGWRIGWTISSAKTAKHIEHIANCILFGVAPFIQDAATNALTTFSVENNFVADLYQKRRDLVCDALSSIDGVKFHKPHAGIYMMLDISASGLTSSAFAHRLLDDSGVSLLPGEAFGPNAAGFLRMSLCAPDETLVAACEKLNEFLRKL